MGSKSGVRRYALPCAAAAIALFASACSSSSGSKSAASSGGSSATTSAAKDPIKFALLADQSGPNAENGNPFVAGVTAAVKATNDAGGINGAKIDLTVVDGASTPQGAQAGAKQVLAMSPLPAATLLGTASAGLAGTTSLWQTAPTMPVMAGTVLDQVVLPKPAPWFFSIAQPSAMVAKYYVGGLKLALGGSLQGKSIAFEGLENPAVDQGLASMKTQIEAQGGKVVTTEHDAATSTSFTSQAANIAAKKPDGVAIYTTLSHTAAVATALVQAGVKAPMLAGDAASDTAVLKQVNAANFYVVRVYNERDPADQLTAIAKKYDLAQYAPMSYFARGWSAAQAVILAATKCASPCKSLTGAIESLGTFDIPNGAMIGSATFSADRHWAVNQAQLVAWVNDKVEKQFTPIDISGMP